MLFKVLALAIVLALLALACYAVFIVYHRKKYAHIPGPPIKSFFSGHADVFKKNVEKGEYPTDHVVLEWHKMYGKVICVWFYHQPMISVCDPDIVKYLLVTKSCPKAEFAYAPFASVFGERCMGHGLVTEMDYEKWNADRRAFNPAFHRKYLKDMMPAFNASTDLLIHKLLELADGKQEVTMAKEFSKLALDVICKVAFGMDVDLINETTNKFPNTITTLMKGAERASLNPYDWMNPLSWSKVRGYRSAIRFIRDTGRKVVEFRKLAMNHGEQVPNDILQHIVALPEKSGPTDIEEMLDHFVTFFIAGHETTANKLAFCVLELAHHEDIEERLVQEVFQVIGDRTTVEFDDLAKMHQLGNALKETLRMYPTATGTLRKVESEETFDGIKIPPGTPVLVSSYVSGRFPEFWANAEDFNPLRFEDTDQANKSHFTTFPFSLGDRNCIGQHFAQIEAKVVLARFLQTFKFKLAPGQTKRIVEVGTIRPHDGVVCTLTKRK